MKDTLQLNAYPFAIRPLSAEDSGGFQIEFPDVPGVMSDGDSAEEAIENGRDALKSALLTLREFGDLIPKPGAFAAASGQWRQRVPKTLHARLVERAKAGDVSLNTLVTAMMAEELGQRQPPWPPLTLTP